MRHLVVSSADIINTIGRFPHRQIQPSERMKAREWKCEACGAITKSETPIPKPAPCGCGGIFFTVVTR